MTQKTLIDEKERENILHSEKNVVVLASAGSGKTTTMVNKIKWEIDRGNPRRFYAAITFTKKAANELLEKLESKFENIVCGTIDSFVMSEIIRNYFHAVYPNHGEFEISYKEIYQFDTFEKGLDQIYNDGILGKYVYERQKEGKNFKLELALDILKKSQAAREYLKYKYAMIFIDEYQDSDHSMHNLFMYLMHDLEIRLFLVGDTKQSIYQWRGASPEFLLEISNSPKFETYKLVENFRSHTDIVEFCRCVVGETVRENYVNEGRVCYCSVEPRKSDEWVIRQLIEKGIIDESKGILILIGKNDDIEWLYYKLGGSDSNFSMVFRIPFEGGENETFLLAICRYYYDKNYTEYDFVEDALYGNEMNRKSLKDLKVILDNLCKDLTSKSVEECYEFCGFSTTYQGYQSDVDNLIKVLNDIKYESYFMQSIMDKNTILTTHTAKGLEYDQVVIFTRYYMYKKNINKENHYVGITRAKEKLILIDNGCEYRERLQDIIDQQSGEYTFEHFIRNIDLN